MTFKKVFEPFDIDGITCQESKGDRIVVGVGRHKNEQKAGCIHRGKGELAAPPNCCILQPRLAMVYRRLAKRALAKRARGARGDSTCTIAVGFHGRHS